MRSGISIVMVGSSFIEASPRHEPIKRFGDSGARRLDLDNVNLRNRPVALPRVRRFVFAHVFFRVALGRVEVEPDLIVVLADLVNFHERSAFAMARLITSSAGASSSKISDPA